MAVFNGNDENNSITGTSFDDEINGFGGNDTLSGDFGDDILSGGTGFDRLEGDAGDDYLLGGDRRDTLIGGTGTDTLEGGTDEDTYFVDNKLDIVIEGVNPTDGNDQVYSSVSFTLPENVEDLSLNEEITLITDPSSDPSSAINGTGNNLDNSIEGNRSDNIISGLDGDDTLSGGSFYIDSGDLIFDGSGNDTLDGGNGSDNLIGGVGNDKMVGGAGNDSFDDILSTIVIGIIGPGSALIYEGADTLVGGEGDDSYTVDNLGDSIVEQVNEGQDIVISILDADYTLGANVDDLVLLQGLNGTGNKLDNVIIGNPSNNTINGNAGADVLLGGKGTDTLIGGKGDDILDFYIGLDFYRPVSIPSALIFLYEESGADVDTLIGGKGNDFYFVDNANDLLVEKGNEGINDVITDVIGVYTSLENTNFESLITINSTVTGNSRDNTLISVGNNAVITGKKGNDTLGAEGLGTLTLIGGVGNDTYLIELDTKDGLAPDSPIVRTYNIDEKLNEGTDLVKSKYSFTLSSNLENLTLLDEEDFNVSFDIDGTGNTLNNRINGNNANNLLDGESGNDTLIGGGGIDTLIGGIGNDSLAGGAGDDRLTGNAGKDRFVFKSKTEGLDTITDFVVVDDTIDVSKAGFGGGLTAGAAITAAQFRVGTGAGDSSDRFIYNRTTGALLFDADGTGASAQLQFAQLSTGLSMTNNDIFVIV